MGLFKKFIDPDNPLVQRWWRNQISWRRPRQNTVYLGAALLLLASVATIYRLFHPHEVANYEHLNLLLADFTIVGLSVIFLLLLTFAPWLSLRRSFRQIQKSDQLTEQLLTPMTSRERHHGLWVEHGLIHALVCYLFVILVIIYESVADLSFWEADFADGGMVVETLNVISALIYPLLQAAWSFAITLHFTTGKGGLGNSTTKALLIILLPGMFALIFIPTLWPNASPTVHIVCDWAIFLLKFFIVVKLFRAHRIDLNERFRLCLDLD